jgi:pteridine reductase
VALHLAERGFDLAITYRTPGPDVPSLVQAVERMGGRCVAIHVDLLGLPESIERIANGMAKFADRLDGLVHNASLYEPDRPDDWRQSTDLWRIHVEAPLLLTRRLMPQLKASRGCVITMCDILARRPMKGWLAYCASKAGLESLTLGLARELAPEARACGVAPGVALWPVDYPEAEKAKYLQRVPLERAGEPEDVARLVHFLLTEGTYVTGQVIPVDGGRSIVP